jgi:hypothetical protein
LLYSFYYNEYFPWIFFIYQNALLNFFEWTTDLKNCLYFIFRKRLRLLYDTHAFHVKVVPLNIDDSKNVISYVDDSKNDISNVDKNGISDVDLKSTLKKFLNSNNFSQNFIIVWELGCIVSLSKGGHINLAIDKINRWQFLN